MLVLIKKIIYLLKYSNERERRLFNMITYITLWFINSLLFIKKQIIKLLIDIKWYRLSIFKSDKVYCE